MRDTPRDRHDGSNERTSRSGCSSSLQRYGWIACRHFYRHRPIVGSTASFGVTGGTPRGVGSASNHPSALSPKADFGRRPWEEMTAAQVTAEGARTSYATTRSRFGSRRRELPSLPSCGERYAWATRDDVPIPNGLGRHCSDAACSIKRNRRAVLTRQIRAVRRLRRAHTTDRQVELLRRGGVTFRTDDLGSVRLSRRQPALQRLRARERDDETNEPTRRPTI